VNRRARGRGNSNCRWAGILIVADHHVLFICGGAFVGLEEIIAMRLGRGGFGFGQMSEIRQVATDGLLRQVKPEDLERFGLIPEIIGRLPVIAPLDALGVDDLARILQSTKGSLQRFTLELRTLLSFSLDFLASSVGLVCDPRVNRCNPAVIPGLRFAP